MRPGERSVLRDRHGQVVLGARYVALRLPEPRPALSFALHGGGSTCTRLAAIHEVRNADLPPELDAAALLAERMRALGDGGIGMLTSRDVSAFEHSTLERDGSFARALVTCGLSNALRAGDLPGALEAWGTINIVLQLSRALSELALLEALSLVAEARTLAVYEAGIPSRRSGAIATGTGTDCIAVIAGGDTESGALFAGKHTLLGHLVGQVVFRSVSAAIARWKTEVWDGAR